MIKGGTSANVFITAGLVILLLVAGRGYLALWDFSYFFVAGSDFVNQAATPAPVWVQNGQGYDGQFFYRYALDPLDFSKTNHGVTVDFVSYRIQRIGYPALAWLFSFGGIPQLVPYALVMVNLFAFMGILLFFHKFILLTQSPIKNLLLPLFLFGLYMSVARDLSEVTELFFFIGALWFYFNRSLLLYAILALLALLCRETSLIAFAALAGYEIFTMLRAKKFQVRLIWMLLPLVCFVIWKAIIIINTSTDDLMAGSGSIGWPLYGIFQGWRGNMDSSTTKNIFQLTFWILYFSWQLWLVMLVVSTVFKQRLSNSMYLVPLFWIYFSWLLFSLVLSSAIYADDWSFVRVFSLWNLTGMILLITSRQTIPNLFQIYSWVVLILTLGRLIVRP